MRKGGVGGAKTQEAGAKFEDQTTSDLLSTLLGEGWKVESKIHKNSNATPTAYVLKNQEQSSIEIYFKNGIHTEFFIPKGVDTKHYFSARLEPDTAIYSASTNVLTIIEKKQQTGSGSVAEKLQTCDYKMMYYKTLCAPLGIEVDLIWQLGEYFVNQESNLKSVFEYMLSKGSRYYFHRVPVGELRI